MSQEPHVDLIARWQSIDELRYPGMKRLGMPTQAIWFESREAAGS